MQQHLLIALSPTSEGADNWVTYMNYPRNRHHRRSGANKQNMHGTFASSTLKTDPLRHVETMGKVLVMPPI